MVETEAMDESKAASAKAAAVKLMAAEADKAAVSSMMGTDQGRADAAADDFSKSNMFPIFSTSHPCTKREIH